MSELFTDSSPESHKRKNRHRYTFCLISFLKRDTFVFGPDIILCAKKSQRTAMLMEMMLRHNFDNWQPNRDTALHLERDD